VDQEEGYGMLTEAAGFLHAELGKFSLRPQSVIQHN